MPASTDVDELTTTVAPQAANRRAVAAPIPDDEPVIRTVWPEKSVVADVAEKTATDRPWPECRTGTGPVIGSQLRFRRALGGR